MSSKTQDAKKLSFPSPELKDSSTYVRTYVSYVCSSSSSSSSSKRSPATTSFYPEIWQEFRKAVDHHEERGVHANHVLEGFMIWYIESYGYKPQQVRITNYFINKPEQVNIAEKVVVEKPKRKRVDYSKLPLEKLQKLYDRYSLSPGRYYARLMLIQNELNQRGVG
jgi:hypothetical protein